MLMLTIEDVLGRFYDRRDEVDFVQELLKSNGHSQRIINFFGLAGSGKSWLLRWLYHKYQEKICCCLLVMEDIAKSSIPKVTLLNKIASDFASTSGYDRTVPNFSGRHTTQKFENYLDDFFDYMRDRGSLLLLVDDYDAFPSDLREIIERSLLSKMVESDFALAVLSSRYEPDFEHPQTLRLHTNHLELTTFNYESISGKYQEYLELIPRILRITAGLPVCVESMIEALRQRGVTTESEFVKDERDFVRGNYDAPISNRVLANIEPGMQDTICALSIPRRFNIGIMCELLPKVMPEKFQRYTNIDYLDLVYSLGYPSLWNPAKNGYSIHRTVRRILSHYMALLDSDKFFEINDTLLSIYQSQAKVAQFDVYDSVEFLYHQLTSIRLSMCKEASTETITQAFCKYVVSLFRNYLDKCATVDELNFLKEMLETDEDIRDHISDDTKQFMEHTVKLCDAS